MTGRNGTGGAGKRTNGPLRLGKRNNVPQTFRAAKQHDPPVEPERNAVEITATCKLAGRTGVEMEALTAVSVAALTVYDMCKAVDRSMRIEAVRLVHKSGGKSGTFEAE